MNLDKMLNGAKSSLQNLYRLSKIPFRVFSRDDVDAAYPEDASFWLGLPCREELWNPEPVEKISLPKLIPLNGGLASAQFTLDLEDGRCLVVAGPVCLREQPFLQVGLAEKTDSPPSLGADDAVRSQLPVLSVQEFCAYLCLLYQAFQGKTLDFSAVMAANFPKGSFEDMKEKVFTTVFSHREEMMPYSSQEVERRFLRSVQNGDVEKVEETIRKTRAQNVGTLSANPLHQCKYMFISLATLVTRAAIEGGVDEFLAFSLSDRYIQRMDGLTGNRDVMDLAMQMLHDFTVRVRDQKEKTPYSGAVAQAVMYIRRNLHRPLSVPEIAEQASLSPDYFSTLFHRETGKTLSAFIQEQRIEEAKDALRFSSYSTLEIANFLCFSTQSYFSQVFKQHTGMTPGEYRKAVRRKE